MNEHVCFFVLFCFVLFCLFWLFPQLALIFLLLYYGMKIWEKEIVSQRNMNEYVCLFLSCFCVYLLILMNNLIHLCFFSFLHFFISLCFFYFFFLVPCPVPLISGNFYDDLAIVMQVFGWLSFASSLFIIATW